MSDIDAVVELLERWRDATGMGRLRIGMDATRVIAQLPPERKRALAIEVAERVAPQLVPAIESESGDLTSEQVGALVDLLRRADREQLDGLVTALKTGDVGGAIDLVDDAVDVIAPPDEVTDDLLEDIAEPDDEDEVDIEDMPVDADEDLDDEIEITEDGTVEVDEEAIRARMEEEAAARAARFRDSTRDAPKVPAYRAPDLDFISDLELPDPTVDEMAPLEERLGDLPGGARATAPAVPTPATARTPAPPVNDPAPLTAGPITAVVAAVTATPDGYRRRRAAMAAIREGRLGSNDIPTVVRSLGRDTDRSWVAGAALDAGLIGASDLDSLGLLPTAAARLRRRVQ